MGDGDVNQEDLERMDDLEKELSDIAALWRGSAPEDSNRIVNRYHAVYSVLYGLGWKGSLDIDAELPDRLMPPEYRARFD